MSAIRKFFPEVRLKAMVGDPKGARCGDMIERAAENLENVREGCLAGVDETIERIHELIQIDGPPSLDKIHTLSNDIFAVAGSFGLGELSQAAYSLCALLDNANGKAVPMAAIRVHVDTMRALRRHEIASNRHMRTATLAELRALVSRLTGAVK